MLCPVNMKNEINLTVAVSVQVKQLAGTRKTESNYMEGEN